MKGPLDGVKVIDLSLLLPGPLCSMHLGDMGAEIIKVENPRQTDLTRYSGAKVRKGDAEESGMFLMVNRNKKGITINLKRPEGQQVLHKLLETADILLEGFRPGALAKMGLGYEDLKEKYPRLIVCAISGYGASGPYKNLAGHDGNYISYSGLLGITGDEKGKPVLPGFQVADIAGGTLVALSSILAALYSREKTGKGQFLDVSMMDGAFSLLTLHAGEYLAGGTLPPRGKMMLSGGLPNYQVYECGDGRYVMLGALEERFFRSFLRAVGKEEILDGLKLEAETISEEIFRKLHPQLKEIFLGRNRDDWADIFSNPDTCLAPVNDLGEAFRDPQLQARDMIITMKHPDLGEIKLIGSPFQFSGTPVTYRHHPPRHGEHTDEILKGLGYSQGEIQHLRESRSI